MNYALSELVLLFFVYGFLGWCTEVAFAAFKSGRFVNRGFLNGPVCPIYGFGLVGVVLLLAPLKGNLWLLFVGSFVITTLIELVTGFLLEKLFHAKWWDYSGMPLNIGGYVCLLFSLIWGVACMAIVLWVHPPIYGLVHRLPKLLTNILDGVFLATLAVDLAATVATIRKLSRRLARITLLADEIHTLTDELGGNIDLGAVRFLQRLNETLRGLGCMTIAEESSSYPGVTADVREGGLGFTFKWDMGFMHDTLDYFSMDPLYRRYHHDKLTFSMMYAFSEHFILAFSHDEVVHGKKSMVDKMFGSYEQKFAALRALYGYQYAHPGKKLGFMGGEFAQFI